MNGNDRFANVQDAYPPLHGSHSSIYEQTLEAVSLANSLNTAAAAFTPLFAANSSMMQSAASANTASLLALGGGTATSGLSSSLSAHDSVAAAAAAAAAAGLHLVGHSATGTAYGGHNSSATGGAGSHGNSHGPVNLRISLPVSPLRSSLQSTHPMGALDRISSAAVSSLLPPASLASAVSGGAVASLVHVHGNENSSGAADCFLSPISVRNSNSGILDMTSAERRNSDLPHLTNVFCSSSRLSPATNVANEASNLSSISGRQNSLAGDSRISSPVSSAVGGFLAAAAASGSAGAAGGSMIPSGSVLSHLSSTSLNLLHASAAGSSRKLSIPSIKVERESPPCEHTQEGMPALPGRAGDGSLGGSHNSIITLSSDDEDSKF